MADWDAEHHLDETIVREILGEQFPALANETVAFLKEGWDSRAYEVGERWIFRFPKRAAVGEQLEREWTLLKELAPRLPVAIPQYEHYGAPSTRFPLRFGGYGKLRGRDARNVGPADVTPGVVADLGAFLSALHAVPAEVAARAGIAHHGWRAPDTMRQRALKALEGLSSLLRPTRQDACRRFIDAGCEHAAATTPPAEALRLLHNDFSSDHLLLDEHSERVTGIIDWSDVEIGDPAVDIAGVYQFLGEAGTRRVLAFYRGAWDEATLGRARYFAGCVALFQLFYGNATGREDDLACGWRTLALALPDQG